MDGMKVWTRSCVSHAIMQRSLQSVRHLKRGCISEASWYICLVQIYCQSPGKKLVPKTRGSHTFSLSHSDDSVFTKVLSVIVASSSSLFHTPLLFLSISDQVLQWSLDVAIGSFNYLQQFGAYSPLELPRMQQISGRDEQLGTVAEMKTLKNIRDLIVRPPVDNGEVIMVMASRTKQLSVSLSSSFFPLTF